MTDAAVDNEPAANVVVGRSLWGDAWARLKANRAAMFSLFYLGLMALVCIAGPWFVPHDYTTIYSDYVRTPPSTEAYPRADMVKGALDDVLKRMRVDLKDWKLEDGRATITVAGTRPIDERYLRYVDRSDTFDDARMEAKSPDGLEMTFSAAVKQQYFLFGTDNVGRDLLSRTLVAGRISLAIGLLAGVVAVTIGVVYGATAGFIHGALIAESQGLDVAQLGSIVAGISPSFGAFFQHEGKVIQSGDFTVSESPLRISVEAARRILDSSKAAGINTDGAAGGLRVTGLAAVYASVFRTWLEDDDPGHARTMAALDRRLRRGESAIRNVEQVASVVNRLATDGPAFLRSVFRGRPPSPPPPGQSSEAGLP